MIRITSTLPTWARVVLPLLAFAALVGFYVYEAHHIRFISETVQNQSTASIKLLPLPEQMWQAFLRVVTPNADGEIKLLLDSMESVRTFAYGMAFVSLGVVIGMYMGLFPLADSVLKSFFVFLDKVPPLLLLPILFMVFGTGLVAKVALVVIGVIPGVVLDAYGRTKEIPRDLILKSQSLGATDQEVAWSIAFPWILPKMLGSLRLNFKAAWGYVIAGEFISAAVGIGYTVFVAKRYTAMDMIIPYVLWATMWMFVFDMLVQWWERSFRWVDK
jgi:NitT/TauT family transport system permease protein